MIGSDSDTVYTSAEILPRSGATLLRRQRDGDGQPNCAQYSARAQVDFRISKNFSLGRLRAAPSIELNNLFNANGVEAFNGRVNDTYPTPTRTQFGRYAKFKITLNY